MDKSTKEALTGVGFVQTTEEILKNTETKSCLIIWKNLKVARCGKTSAYWGLDTKLFFHRFLKLSIVPCKKCIAQELVETWFKVVYSLLAHNNVLFCADVQPLALFKFAYSVQFFLNQTMVNVALEVFVMTYIIFLTKTVSTSFGVLMDFLPKMFPKGENYKGGKYLPRLHWKTIGAIV